MLCFVYELNGIPHVYLRNQTNKMNEWLHTANEEGLHFATSEYDYVFKIKYNSIGHINVGAV